MESKERKNAISDWKKEKVKILAIAGQRKAGKDVLIQHILKNHPDFKRYRIADAPYLISRILDLPPDRQVYHALFGVNKLLYPLLKESAYKRRVAKMLDAEKPELALVDSLRTREEYEEFVVKRKGILIGIKSSDKVRYERVKADAEHSSSDEKKDEGLLSFQQFLGDKKLKTGEYSPIERETKWILKRADFTIQNDYSSPKEYKKKIEQIMAELGFKKK